MFDAKRFLIFTLLCSGILPELVAGVSMTLKNYEGRVPQINKDKKAQRKLPKHPDEEAEEPSLRKPIASIGFNFSEGAYLDDVCHVVPETQMEDLSYECQAIKAFNQLALDEMPHEDMIDLVSYCACQLANMQHLWEQAFDNEPGLRRLAIMVDKVLSARWLGLAGTSKTLTNRAPKTNQATKHPDYLWSDVEVVMYQVSIWTATSDYFHQGKRNKSLALPAQLRAELDRDQVWRLIWQVCWSISRDPFNVYRYMENVIRASPPVFFNLLQLSDTIATVYTASKACKLPLMLHFDHYKLTARQSPDEILNPSGNGAIRHKIFNLTQTDNQLEVPSGGDQDLM